MRRRLSIATWIFAAVAGAIVVILLLPFLFSSSGSTPMSIGLNWLREIRLAQLEVHKGALGTSGFWRKDVRGLAIQVINGSPAGLITRRIADSDIGEGGGEIDLQIPEITLRALGFAGEPPVDPSRYGVALWVSEGGGWGGGP